MSTETRAKHTPGLWEVEVSDEYLWTYKIKNARVGGRTVKEAIPEDEANARLIAAAPDLLEALEDARRILGGHLAYLASDGSMEGTAEFFALRDFVQATGILLAKATGEQP